MCLFWVKMISGNHFHPNPHVWLQRKIKFSGNHLPVDQNLRLWPGNEFTLSFSLQFISGSRNTLREWEKERRESPKRTATQRKREGESTPLRPAKLRPERSHPERDRTQSAELFDFDFAVRLRIAPFDFAVRRRRSTSPYDFTVRLRLHADRDRSRSTDSSSPIAIVAPQNRSSSTPKPIVLPLFLLLCVWPDYDFFFSWVLFVFLNWGMKLYICLAGEKMWENVFSVWFWFLLL